MHHHLVVERADFGARIPEFRIQISASRMNKSRPNFLLSKDGDHYRLPCRVVSCAGKVHVTSTWKLLLFIECDVHEYRLPAITCDHFISALGSV